MKSFWLILKQLGKSICYFTLFFGVQFIILMALEIYYIFRESVRMAITGVEPDVNVIVEGALDFMLESTNLVGIISGMLTISALWLFFRVRKKKLSVETNMVKMSGQYIPLIVLLGFVLATSISFGLNLLPESVLEAYAEQSSAAFGSSGVIMVLSNMIVAPFVEEIIFRGLILSRLRKALPVTWAVILSSLIFGVAHGQIVWMAYAFILGLFCAILTVKTGSLAAGILLHAVFNVCGTVVPLLCEDITSMPVITVVAIVGAIATAVVMTVIVRMSVKGKDKLVQMEGAPSPNE